MKNKIISLLLLLMMLVFNSNIFAQQQKYELKIEPIDSTEFNAFYAKYYIKKTFKMIDNFEEAKKYIGNAVEFGERGDVLSLKTRKGKKLEYPEGETGFSLYFPDLDILHLEVGHNMDVTYNLKTGEGGMDVGSPTNIVTSPNGKFRLNGHFDGQECMVFYIEKKSRNKFKQIATINREYSCYMSDQFWVGNSTLYFKCSYCGYSHSDCKTYKLTIIKKQEK